MNKHIFCDLDGTLLKDFKDLDLTDIEKLQQAQSLGCTVSIATGRLDYEVSMIMNKYKFNGYRISQNGALVFNQNNEVIYKKKLKSELILEIVNALKQFEVIIIFQTDQEYYVEEKLKILEDFERSQEYIRYNENKNILFELDNYEMISISVWAHKGENKKIKEYEKRKTGGSKSK